MSGYVLVHAFRFSEVLKLQAVTASMIRPSLTHWSCLLFSNPHRCRIVPLESLPDRQAGLEQAEMRYAASSGRATSSRSTFKNRDIILGITPTKDMCLEDLTA